MKADWLILPNNYKTENPTDYAWDLPDGHVINTSVGVITHAGYGTTPSNSYSIEGLPDIKGNLCYEDTPTYRTKGNAIDCHDSASRSSDSHDVPCMVTVRHARPYGPQYHNHKRPGLPIVYMED